MHVEHVDWCSARHVGMVADCEAQLTGCALFWCLLAQNVQKLNEGLLLPARVCLSCLS